MERIGVVLAGGAATRLPNKALLPLRNGKPAVTSAIELLNRSGCGDVVLVVPPCSAIPYVVRSLGHRVRVIEQTEPNGVPAALDALRGLLNYRAAMMTEFVVAYCDNVYGADAHVPSELPAVPCHSVMSGLNPSKSKHLARYVNGTWVREAPNGMFVAGWMVLQSRDLLEAAQFNSTEGLLNFLNAEPVQIEDKYWWDIGTPDAYLSYWKEK